jgi:hypothetical protein
MSNHDTWQLLYLKKNYKFKTFQYFIVQNKTLISFLFPKYDWSALQNKFK